MSDIFISYKREEQEQARKLAVALEKRGWSVWWDPMLRAGEHFDDAIEAALNKARCVIVMWSRLSVQSRYVKDEATYALKRKKLAPVAIEDVELPFRFEGIHTPKLVDWDGSEDSPEFQRLVDDIAEIIGPPPVEPEKQFPVGAKSDLTAPEIYQPAWPKRELAFGLGFLCFLLLIALGAYWENLPKDQTEKIAARSVSESPGSKTKKELLIPEMVTIPAGSYDMGGLRGDGSLDEKPVHEVHISKSFALGKYPVTFDQYDKFAKDTGRELPDDEGWGRGQRPVIQVSWEDARDYVAWLSKKTGKQYRLPTEAEWEYAARSGGKKQKWAGTSSEKELGDYARYRENSASKTYPVGEKKPNELGLYDMSGNVYEWVQDCWHATYDHAPNDGTAWLEEDGGACEVRVIRGGCWFDLPWKVRASSRDMYHVSPAIC